MTATAVHVHLVSGDMLALRVSAHLFSSSGAAVALSVRRRGASVRRTDRDDCMPSSVMQMQRTNDPDDDSVSNDLLITCILIIRPVSILSPFTLSFQA